MFTVCNELEQKDTTYTLTESIPEPVKDVITEIPIETPTLSPTLIQESLDTPTITPLPEVIEFTFKNANVGDIITFGVYEQDNNLGNGKEPIEWVVLSRDGEELLLLSKYALDCQPYHIARRCAPTAFAVAQGVYQYLGADRDAYTTEGKGACSWWLRSPGYNLICATYVMPVGEVFDFGEWVNSSFVSVRPALYLNMKY